MIESTDKNLTAQIMSEKRFEENAKHAAEFIKEYEGLMTRMVDFARMNGQPNVHPVEFCHSVLSGYALKKLSSDNQIIALQ